MMNESVEYRRLRDEGDAWQLWGPYVSERQWGTVREDYSPGGDAWDYLPHDHARSRAYRWGEDGIAGFSDDRQRWCLGLALWNGRDPILKERMFGLANEQGNHGEDVKEYWWYLDATPSHSYVRMLYKYPHAEYPYADLLNESLRRRAAGGMPEYELVDTGIFAENRYFDVTVEYAQAAPGDILMKVTAINRGPEAAELHLLPQLWARNTWSWNEGAVQPRLRQVEDGTVLASRNRASDYRFEALQDCDMLFCENETNRHRLFGAPRTGYPKDGINDFVVDGDNDAINPARIGSKCAALSKKTLAPGETWTLRLRFAPAKGRRITVKRFDGLFDERRAEADSYYAALQHDLEDADKRLVQRQALAGLIWTKQYYRFDVRRWLAGDPTQPPPPEERLTGRDSLWKHLDNADIVSMPDKWEYPWYAAWDLAFHCVAFALTDPKFAKKQLRLLTLDGYMNPNGALPAYEWNFSDVNPPVQAWAAWRVYQIDKAANNGVGDIGFLEQMLHKLMLNFTWWVNRVDPDGRNIFQGGFLGLDNIGVFDRSKPLPTGGYISQSDGTAWMAMFSLDLMRMALEVAMTNPAYEDIATKFFDHFLLIAEAMTDLGEDSEGLWDEQDGFYYDRLHLPDGEEVPLRVRSLVGLIPLCAVDVLDGSLATRFPAFTERLRWTAQVRPKLAELVSRWQVPGAEGRVLLSLLRRKRMNALLKRMLDETEFLSDHGIRSLSKAHAEHPYVYDAGTTQFSVEYAPGESKTMMFGGNSNWRGPIWMPINVLLIEALYEFETFYGPDYKLPFPTGSDTLLSMPEIAEQLSHRLATLFLRGPDGRRPVLGDNAMFQTDPLWRDNVPFYEYFHGDTGAGLGASHQTGWTGLIALLLQPRIRDAGRLTPSSGETR